MLQNSYNICTICYNTMTIVFVILVQIFNKDIVTDIGTNTLQYITIWKPNIVTHIVTLQ